METLKVIGPAHWASYLINGDATGFDYSNTPDNPKAGERELADAQAFEAACVGHFADAGEPYFVNCAWIPTLGAFSGNVCEYTILIDKVHA